MCCFSQYYFLLLILLTAIANALPETGDQNEPLPAAAPLEALEQSFDTSSPSTIDQFQNDLGLKQPGDYTDPNVSPHDWFLPHCKTTFHTLCCKRLPLVEYIKQFVSEIHAVPIVFGCTNCTSPLFNLHHPSD